jgi:ferredoxin
MEEVEISFPDEGREGVVPVGTYLIDAAKRLGISVPDCTAEEAHTCEIIIKNGADLLSPPSKAEKEQLDAESRDGTVRLACYAKIEKPGEIIAMAKRKSEPVEEAKNQEREETYRKEFTELPLEKKIANLVQLEAIALSETFAFVINSPFKVFEKVGDVLAEFGFKKEEEEKRKARPAENGSSDAKSSAKKQKAAADKHEQPEPPTT